MGPGSLGLSCRSNMKMRVGGPARPLADTYEWGEEKREENHIIFN